MGKDNFFLNFAEITESILLELTEGPSPVLDVSSTVKTGDPVLKNFPQHDHCLIDGSEMQINKPSRSNKDCDGSREIAMDVIQHTLSGDIME